MRRKQVLMAYNKSRQEEIEVINGSLAQVYSTLDSIKSDVESHRVTTNAKLDLLKSSITNCISDILHTEFLTLEAFAQQVKLQPDTVRRKLNSGELLGLKLRNKWYVRRSQLWNFDDAEEDL